MWERSVLSLVLWSFIALAPGDAHAANAVPLGVEIGVATQSEVRAKLGKATSLADGGVNKFTDGRMLVGDGKGLDVDGLSKIVFIFDQREVLQGVLMTLEKNFKPTYEMLRKKYTLVSKQIPFVGDSSAKFSQGSSFIMLDAPHLSFEMTLSYVSQSLHAAFQNRTARDRAKHDEDQQGKL